MRFVDRKSARAGVPVPDEAKAPAGMLVVRRARPNVARGARVSFDERKDAQARVPVPLEATAAALPDRRGRGRKNRGSAVLQKITAKE